jgi:beta-ureidopropionase / N-carbamoyl-L-amino-acid hydrolase
VRHLHAKGERLPYHLEIVGFAEEEGVRFRSTFLGSNAIAGCFDMAQLDQLDADGTRMRDALAAAGHEPGDIAAIARKRSELLGFVEVHIEQGPVLLDRGLALGVVTAIAGSSRYLVELTGLASHAGTTPMTMRKDAAAAAAEIVLLVEQRCGGIDTLVGTVGQLQVPGGSVNVIPGHCKLSLDIRAASDAVRLAAVQDILDGIAAICARRQVEPHIEQIVAANAVPCAPWMMDQIGAAVEQAGLPRFDLPSGAGHDAMAMAKVTDVAMLFTRCGNGGISHNRLETMTGDDAEMAGMVMLDYFRCFRAR